MSKEILYLGLDVHAENIAVAIAEAGRDGDVRNHGVISSDLQNVEKLLRKLGHPRKELRVCYEAGPCGFVLARRLKQWGIACAVVAPSLTPKGSGDKIKTDLRDARMLARLHRAGELTAVHVPDERDEDNHAVLQLTGFRACPYFRHSPKNKSGIAGGTHPVPPACRTYELINYGTACSGTSDTYEITTTHQEILKKATKKTAKSRYVNSPQPIVGSPLPPSEGAKVKLDLAGRNNDNLMAFATQHDADMKDNPNFVTPMPSAADFEATMAAFGQSIVEWMSARSAADSAAGTMARCRAALETALTHRGNYVEIASNDVAPVIQSAGFGVRAPRTPAAPPNAPGGLAVDPNGVSGLMMLSWNADLLAKGYLVQVSEDVQPRVTTAKLSFSDMDVGKTYVFQAASLGGATGQSPWSPEVSRAAA